MTDPKHCALYLKRACFLLDLLGNPEKKIPHYIHVTGTSGKGSVCAFLHAILQAAGKRVGALTSPHPTWITERWQIGSQIMSQQEFVQIVREIKPVLDAYERQSPYTMVSYSELMTIIGLYYFAKKIVTWAVIEVGCGGRYDATNILPKKDIAVITNIGTDHAHLIGPTKAEIAYEKAGIIKSGCRVFTMENNKLMLSILEKEAKKVRAIAFNRTLNRDVRIITSHLTGSHFTYRQQSYHLTVPGRHQIANAALAIDIAQALKIPAAAIKHGLAAAKQPLRMEVVSSQPLIILDSAHNIEKIRTTVTTMRKLGGNLHLIIGFCNDKPWKKMVHELATLRPATIACTRNTINPFRKAADPKALAKEFKKNLPKVKTEIFLDPQDALAWSRKKIKAGNIILVTGSIFLSGELRSSLTK